MPEIPPPPSRPPPPIPQTAFISKETNKLPPSPALQTPGADLAYSPQSIQNSEYFPPQQTQSPAMYAPARPPPSSPVTWPPSPTRLPPLPSIAQTNPPPPPTQPPPPPPPPPTSNPPPPPPRNPPPPPPDFLNMPENPPIYHQTLSPRLTSPPMPTYQPQLPPPQVSPVNATGLNSSMYNHSEPLDMPHTPVWDGDGFNINEDEDLYAEVVERDGKFAERGQKNDNCVVQSLPALFSLSHEGYAYVLWRIYDRS